MKTYYIELDSGDATVYAPSKKRAILNFFNFRHKVGDEMYSVKKEKGELKLYYTYDDKQIEIDVTEVTEEGVINYVEH